MPSSRAFTDAPVRPPARTRPGGQIQTRCPRALHVRVDQPTRTRSVGRIATAADSDRIDSLQLAHASDPPLDANLCDALLLMRPRG